MDLTLTVEHVSGIHPCGSLDDVVAGPGQSRHINTEPGLSEIPPEAFVHLKATLGKTLRRMPRLVRLALIAAESFGRATAGNMDDAVIVATRCGSVCSTFDFMDSLLENGAELASPTAFSHSVTNMPAALIGQHFGFRGPAMTITDAEGNAFHSALITAYALLNDNAARRAFLWVMEEQNTWMEAIITATLPAEKVFLETALLFVLTKTADPNLPFLSFAPTAPASPASAWNAAIQIKRAYGSEISNASRVRIDGA